MAVSQVMTGPKIPGQVTASVLDDTSQAQTVALALIGRAVAIAIFEAFLFRAFEGEHRGHRRSRR
jgi:hypothetical protein